jgi:hypothetical protein
MTTGWGSDESGRTQVYGFWTPNGFWQLLPPEPIHYEIPDMTAEERIEAAQRYIKSLLAKNGYTPWGVQSSSWR